MYTRFCSSKVNILIDLAYEILDYCVHSQLNHASTLYLMSVISKEFDQIIQNGEPDFDFLSRFKIAVSDTKVYEQRMFNNACTVG